MAEFDIPGAPPASPREERRRKYYTARADQMLEGAPPGTELTSEDIKAADRSEFAALSADPDMNVGVAPVPPPELDKQRVEAVEQHQRDTERRLNIAQVETKKLPTPDEASRLKQAATSRGVPFGVALLDPQRVDTQAPVPWDTYAGNKPLADILLDPEKRVLTYDEADKLAAAGDLVRNPLPTSKPGQLWEQGSDQISRDLLSSKRAIGDGTLSPDDQREIERIDTRLSMLPSADTIGGQVLEGIAQQGPRMLRMAGVGAAGAVVGGAIGALGGGLTAPGVAAVGATTAIAVDNGLQAIGNVYSELTEQVGIPHNIAKPAAIIGGAIVAGLDTLSFGALTKIPALNILRKIPAFQKLSGDVIRPALRAAVKDQRFVKLLGELALDAGREGSTEVLQEIAQILTDYAAAGAAPKGDYRLPTAAEAGQRVALSGLVGAAAGAVTGGAATAARELALRVDTGEKSKAYIDRLYEVTEGLKSAERAPEVLKEYVDRHAKNGPVQKVTVTGEAIVSLAQAAETPEQKAFFARPDIARQMEQAKATGARVSLTLGEFAAYVRPLDEGKSLAQSIGLNDEMSAEEAKEIKPAIEKAKKEMADIAKRKDLIENEPTSIIERDIEKQLRSVGATAEGAQVQARLLASGVATLAKRAGKDPFEVYQQARIRVSNVTHENANTTTLEQADPKGVQKARWGSSSYTTYEHAESPIRLYVEDDAPSGAHISRVLGFNDKVKENADVKKAYGAQGYSTAIYLRAIRNAQEAGAAFRSDSARSEATDRMFARLQRLGIPFALKKLADIGAEVDGDVGDDAFHISAEDLKKVDLEAAWAKLTGEKPRADGGQFAALTDDEINTVVSGLQELQHKQNDEVRGRITFDPTKRDFFLITLTGKANLSTFLHESAHYLLELMRKLDFEAGADSAFSEDLRALEEWAGVKPGEEWSVAALEKFARGMETYFGEGKAPSSKLASAFATVKAWITHVYRVLTNLGAPLTDEVRGVMDRMLATQDEIDARRAELGYFPKEMSDDRADMTPEQQQAYRDLYEKGAQQAQRELDRQAIAALRLETKAEYQRVVGEVEKKLDSHPVLALRAWFKSGGERIDGGLVIPELVGQKFATDDVKAAGVQPGRISDLVAKDGTLDPAELAPYFGFKNGSDLLERLASTPARETLKKQMVKEEMTKLYPAYGPDKAWVEREALTRLHEADSISNAIELELATATKKAGLPPAESPARIATLAARENVQEMTRAELDAQQYRDAEGRAHRAQLKAFAAKDFKEEAEQARRRLYARAMWLEVSRAAEAMDKAKEYAERFTSETALARLGRSSDALLSTGERLGSVIRDAAKGLAESLGLALKSEASDQPFAARIAKIEEVGQPVLIDPALREGPIRQWEELSYREALSVRDALKNLSAIAKGLNELRVGDEMVRLDEIATSVEEGLKAEGVLGRLGRKGEKKNTFRAHRMDISGPERILLDLDGGKLGLAHKLWMGSAEQGQFAAEKRHIQRRDDLRRISDEKRPDGWSKLMKRKFVFTEGDGLEYTGAEVFSMLQNYGTQTNRLKLVEGMQKAVGRTGWTQDSVLAFIHRVFPDRSAYDYAQALFNYISSESLWEDSARVAEKIYGVRPEKVQALPIPTPDGGSIEGGYYPIVRDSHVPLTESQATKSDGLEAMDVNPLATMYAAHGFTEKRTGHTAPLLLDPTALAAHLYEVDHFITQAEGVLDRHRFLTNARVKAAIIHSLGREAWDELKASNNFIAAGGKLLSRELLQSKGVIDKLLFHNALLTMGGNVLSGLNQVVTGVPATIAHLGPRGLPAFGKVLLQFATSPFQMWKEVAEESGEIAGMPMHYDKDLRMVVAREMTGESWPMLKSRVATTMMIPVVFGQKVVNVITFRAAKELALSEGKSLEEAVAAGNSAVRLSQSSSAEKDLAAVQRSNDMLMRVMTSLASYTFALNNLVMPRRLTSKELAGATVRLTSIILATMMTRALFEALFPLLEEKDAERRKGLEKWAEGTEVPGLLAATQAAMDVLGNVPLVGRPVQSVLSGRQPRYASWVDTMVRTAQAAPDAFAQKGLSKAQLKAAVDTIGLATGIPTRHVFFAPSEFISEYVDGNIEDSPWSFFQELALARPGQKGER